MLIWRILTKETYLMQVKLKVVMFEFIEMFQQDEKN